jgi:hypothetical protein
MIYLSWTDYSHQVMTVITFLEPLDNDSPCHTLTRAL